LKDWNYDKEPKETIRLIERWGQIVKDRKDDLSSAQLILEDWDAKGKHPRRTAEALESIDLERGDKQMAEQVMAPYR
jgi:hypothetical protein